MCFSLYIYIKTCNTWKKKNNNNIQVCLERVIRLALSGSLGPDTTETQVPVVISFRKKKISFWKKKKHFNNTSAYYLYQSEEGRLVLRRRFLRIYYTQDRLKSFSVFCYQLQAVFFFFFSNNFEIRKITVFIIFNNNKKVHT